MQWIIKYDSKALQELLKLDKQTIKHIRKYLEERVAASDNPRAYGKALSSNLAGLWRYRVGDYRIIVEIQDNELTILAVKIGHRSKIYGGH